MKTIGFVCTGNTCRSPMAEKLAEKIAFERELQIKAFSRGISVYQPEAAHKNARTTMEKYGLDLSKHRSSQFLKEDGEIADLILTMTKRHKNYIINKYPQFTHKIFAMTEYIEETGDISDPYGGDLDEYQNCAKELNEIIHKIIDKIKEVSL